MLSGRLGIPSSCSRVQPAALQQPLVAPSTFVNLQRIQARHDCVDAIRDATRSHPATICAARKKADADTEAVKSTRTPRDQKHTAPEVLERSAPEHPYPGEFQQTLNCSFTLAGVGLHTGETAIVRVRPALANEGRYFVRVPEGTLDDSLQTEQDLAVNADEAGQLALNPEVEDRKLQLFKRYLLAQDDEGFEGTFQQYLHSLDAQDLQQKWEAGQDVSSQEWPSEAAEPIQARRPDETIIPASIASISVPQAVTLTLGDASSEDDIVIGAEQLLSALEAAGVDNARIEIQGGYELPQLDGSAQGWALEIQFAGVRPAPVREGSEEYVTRCAARPTQPFVVTEGSSFISFVPEDNMRLTAGVDEHQDAKVIGKQWKSWCLYEDLPFRFELAGARKYLPTPTHLEVLTEAGFYKGFTEGTLHIGFGDRFYEPDLVRYVHDEAARCELVHLIGALSLNARPGHSGLPFGHVVAYKANHDLHVKFVKELQARTQPGDWTPVWDVPLSTDFPLGVKQQGEEPEDEDNDQQ